MKIDLKYGFIGMGQKVDEKQNGFAQAKPNRIFLDVGNDLRIGIIDHHQPLEKFQEEERHSSVALLVKYPHYVLQAVNENGKSGKEPIEIVVHYTPDLDCFASAYLVEELLQNGTFPFGYERLVEYVEKNDSGCIYLTTTTLKSLLGISYLIEDVIAAKKAGIIPDNIFADSDSLEKSLDLVFQQIVSGNNEKCLEAKPAPDEIMHRGIGLVRYCMKRLAELQKLAMDAPVTLFDRELIPQNSPFELEYKLLYKDKINYENDINSSICERRQVCLSIRDKETSDHKIVDALFWKNTPNCILHKHWARKDIVNSTLGQGFVMTFIPLPSKPISGFVAQRLALSPATTLQRVIISVDPESDTSLKGLGEALELAEQRKEKLYIKNIEQWRSRSPRPGYEKTNWCNNENPWYDGARHEYTIVDAPSFSDCREGMCSGSLLNIDEIKNITLQYLHPPVKNLYLYYQIPFTFDAKLYSGVKYTTGQCNRHREVDAYFLPYIDRYLFGIAANNESESNVRICKLKLRKDLKKGVIPLLNNETKLKFDAHQSSFDDGLNVSFYNTKMIIFRYGIGFISVQVKLKPINRERKLNFDDLLTFNRTMYFCSNTMLKDDRNESQEWLNKVLREIVIDSSNRIKGFNKESNKGIAISPDRCQIYLTAKIPTQAYTATEEKLIYRLLNFCDPYQSFPDTEHVKESTKNMILRKQQNAVYGYSKNGGCLLIVSKSQVKPKFTFHEGEDGSILQKNFVITNSYIYLLAMHQRLVLTNFLTDLASAHSPRMTKRLRENLLHFIKKGYFSQITNEQNGSDSFKRWRQVLEIDALYNEAESQIKAIDEYQKAEITRNFARYTFYFLPFMIFSRCEDQFISLGKQYSLFNFLEWTPKLLVIYIAIVFFIICWENMKGTRQRCSDKVISIMEFLKSFRAKRFSENNVKD